MTEQSTPLKENVVQKEKEAPLPQAEVIQDVIAAATSATTAPATTIVTPAIPAGDYVHEMEMGLGAYPVEIICSDDICMYYMGLFMGPIYEV